MLRTSFGIKLGGLIVALSAVACAQTPSAPAPVVVEGRTLFVVQTNLGPFTAQERAVATSDRLTRLAKDLTARSTRLRRQRRHQHGYYAGRPSSADRDGRRRQSRRQEQSGAGRRVHQDHPVRGCRSPGGIQLPQLAEGSRCTRF